MVWSVSKNAPSPFISVKEAAVLLRMNPKTIYAAIREGQFPGALKVGRTYRIATEYLLRYQRNGCAPS